MASANLNLSSGDEDDVFSSQFAALLKPIRELTKHGCWEMKIAEKLEEYIHYIQDLPIEVNVNGEQMKLDFAKAAMVVQNSVQIYSKKVENLWLLLQDVIESLSSHGNSNENGEEGQNVAGQKLKKNFRRRHLKGDVNLLAEMQLKFKKTSLKSKKKSTVKEVKKMQILPYEILQLEEVIGSANPLKIKLYTLSNEHLGYPSDLRSNFPFNPNTLFLKIHFTDGIITSSIATEENRGEPRDTDLAQPEPIALPMNQDELEFEPPDLEGSWQNDEDMSDNNMPPRMEERDNMNGTSEEAVERMNLRQRAPAPIHAADREEIKDPWRGMEPYSDDEVMKKLCGAPIRCRLPLALQKGKRKEVGKDPRPEQIDEYLGHGQIGIKKPTVKYCQPENEFWEDYVHFTKTTGTAIKKQQKLRPERIIADVMEESDQEDISNDDNHHYGGVMNTSGGLDNSIDDFHANLPPGSPIGDLGPTEELDESKQFFELVQEYMAKYTASGKEFITSTESTRRVQAWHEMIQPRLREAESRRDFDIHLYGSKILEEFGSDAPVGSQCMFSTIIREQPKNEVARYFLATLQLANAYNVEIKLQEELSLDGVELKLLSRDRHHEHMDEFIS